MSFDLQTFSDIQAELAEMSAAIRALSASQPKAQELADAIDAHLRRGIHSLQEDFIGKFAGLIEPFLKTTKIDTEKLADAQIKLEEKFSSYLKEVSALLKKQKNEIDKILTADAETLKKMLDANTKKIQAQQATLDQLLKVLGGYDQQFVNLYNGSLHLVASNEKTLSKVDAVVERMEKVTNGTLEDLSASAQRTIKETSIEVRREIREMSDVAQQEMEATRTRFLKVLGGFDNRLSEHPMAVFLFLVFVVGVGSLVIGMFAGRFGVEKTTTVMIDRAVESAMQTVNERLERIDEQTKSLDRTFLQAQFWEVYMGSLTYSQQQEVLKRVQTEVDRQGRKIVLPKSMQQEGAKK